MSAIRFGHGAAGAALAFLLSSIPASALAKSPPAPDDTARAANKAEAPIVARQGAAVAATPATSWPEPVPRVRNLILLIVEEKALPLALRAATRA